MAKKKPFIEFQTKEDFDKWFDEIYQNGRKHGFKEGRINGLSYFLGTINERFKDGEINEALRESKDRKIAEWEKQEDFIKRRVEYELKKRMEESSKEA